MTEHSEPWVCYGQTKVAGQGTVFDPKPNAVGLRGECEALPFTVPEGCDLWLEAYGIESYPQAGSIVIVPFIGGPSDLQHAGQVNEHSMHSVAASGGRSSQASGLRYCVPAGKVLHVMLQSAQPGTLIYGWFLSGWLTRYA